MTAEEVRRFVAPKAAPEHLDQVTLAYMVRSHVARYPDLASFAAIPNQGGGKVGTPEMIRAARMKREGLAPGYPDTLLDVARGGYFGLRVELKRESHWNLREGQPYAAGEPDEDQVAWHKRLTLNGYLVAVAWGWSPAWELFKWYLEQPPTLEALPNFRESHPDHITRLRIYERVNIVAADRRR